MLFISGEFTQFLRRVVDVFNESFDGVRGHLAVLDLIAILSSRRSAQYSDPTFQNIETLFPLCLIQGERLALVFAQVLRLSIDVLNQSFYEFGIIW
jgi:hypothetical protein